jgi:hypothetical protein
MEDADTKKRKVLNMLKMGINLSLCLLFFLRRVLKRLLPELWGCQRLRSKLGQSYTHGRDPYALVYKGKDPLVRYPVKIDKEKDLWLIDNFRNSRIKTRKGDTLANGDIASKNALETRWTSALIDINKVTSAKLFYLKDHQRLGPTSTPLGHLQILFEFKRKGVLTPDGAYDRFVSSFDSFKQEGVKWTLLGGLLNSYDSGFVFGSYQDALAKALTGFSGTELHDFRLTQGQLKNFLRLTLEQGTDHERISNHKYHASRNSCTTNQVQLLNEVLPKAQQIQEWNLVMGHPLLRTWTSILPVFVIRELKRLTLLESNPFRRDGDQSIFSEYCDQLKTKSSVFHGLEPYFK